MIRRPNRATKVHNVLLAANEADAVAAMRRDPGLADWTIITAESQLYGLHIDQWAITEVAASNMRQFPKMLAWLGQAQAKTERLRAAGELPR